jgi:hypothetical protein
MNRTLLALSVMSFLFPGMGSAQVPQSPAAGDEVPPITQARLKTLVQEAHTSGQYKTIAGYYGKLQQQFLKQAEDERQEWLRRSHSVTSISEKYPRPVDSSRYRYEYFSHKASEMGALVARYNELAAPDLPAAKQ